MGKPTFNITQTGSLLRVKGEVLTRIDGFELADVTLIDASQNKARINANLRRKAQPDIFNPGRVPIDKTFEVGEPVAQVAFTINGVHGAYIKVECIGDAADTPTKPKPTTA